MISKFSVISRKNRKIIKKYPSPGGDGAEVVYALRNNDTLARKIINEIENSGQNVRKYYQRRLPSDSSKDYYYILRDTPNTEALLIEYGFLDSTKDDPEQLKNNYKDYAEAVVKAVTEYAGYNYVPKGDNYYIVQKGDSLYSIARKYNTTVDNLKTINNLKSNLLQIGQKLLISKENNKPNNDEYYIVKSGDTLYKISKLYNISVDELKELNNLSSNILSIGQKLKVKKDTTNNTIYTVVKGDTLYSIARKYNTTVSDLISNNNLKTSMLSIGQKLLIK